MTKFQSPVIDSIFPYRPYASFSGPAAKNNRLSKSPQRRGLSGGPVRHHGPMSLSHCPPVHTNPEQQSESAVHEPNCKLQQVPVSQTEFPQQSPLSIQPEFPAVRQQVLPTQASFAPQQSV